MRVTQITPQNVFQQVTIGGSSAASAAFNAATDHVQLVSTVDCYIVFETAPTATSAGYYLVAKVPQTFGVLKGTSQKVACLEVGSGGVLSIAEGSGL